MLCRNAAFTLRDKNKNYWRPNQTHFVTNSVDQKQSRACTAHELLLTTTEQTLQSKKQERTQGKQRKIYLLVSFHISVFVFVKVLVKLIKLRRTNVEERFPRRSRNRIGAKLITHLVRGNSAGHTGVSLPLKCSVKLTCIKWTPSGKGLLTA